MSECCQERLPCNLDDLREALSIHTRKITDSCRDKDCIEDLRVYLTRGSQALLDTATGAKVRCAELLYTYIDVEPIAFDRNHYCIDVTFYYRILADAVIGTGRPAALYGLAVFSKRAVLCGEDSRAHIYTSETRICEPDGITRYSANRPTAVVEVTDTNSQNRKTNPYPQVCTTRQQKCLDTSVRPSFETKKPRENPWLKYLFGVWFIRVSPTYIECHRLHFYLPKCTHKLCRFWWKIPGRIRMSNDTNRHTQA